MKSVLVILAVVCLALSTPVSKVKRDLDRSGEPDAEFINRRQPGQSNPVIVVDTPVGIGDDDDMEDGDFDFNPGFGYMDRPRFNYNPFYYWRQRMDEINRFFNSLFNRPRPLFPPTTFSFGEPDNYPPDYRNTTFSTKVVNGSLITTNETIVKHQTNGSSFFIHTKIINIRPQNENETVVPTTEERPEEVPVENRPVEETSLPSSPETTSTAIPVDTSNDAANDVNGGGRVF